MSNGYMTTSIKQILRCIPYWSAILLTMLTSPNILAATTGESIPEGLLPHFESLITLAIVLFAGIIAWLLNHSSAKLRATGTGFSAIACIATVVWLISPCKQAC